MQFDGLRLAGRHSMLATYLDESDQPSLIGYG